MKRLLNILHYKLFIWFKFIDKVTNYFNPFWWGVSIPSIKKVYNKKGINDFRKLMDEEIFNHKVTGFNITYAGIVILSLLGLIMFSLVNLLQFIVQKPFIQYIWENPLIRIIFIISLCIIPWKICDKLIFNDNSYLKYFQEFERKSKLWKRTWAWVTLFIVVGVILFFVITLKISLLKS